MSIIKTDHLHRKIKIAGHLEERRDIIHIVLSWTDKTGKRHRQCLSTGLKVKGNKKRAEIILAQMRKEKKAELEQEPDINDVLFADFLEDWLEGIRRNVRVTTFGSYQNNVQCVIAPWFRNKGIMLRELTADDINEFYAESLERVKAKTVQNYHTNISKAIKYALEKDMLPYSIMDKVKRPKAERFVGKFLKESEVIRLVNAVKGHKLELGVLLGAFYGLRRSEVAGLRWKSIDFEANTITIEHVISCTCIDGKRVVVAEDCTKSKASFRTLPLIDTFRQKLMAVKDEQEHNRKLCGNCYNNKDREYIYTDVLGNRVHPEYLTCAFPVFLERNGFDRMRFHDLRHSCASLLLANGVPLKMIQEWLGHGDFAITANTYAHLDYSSKLESAKAMSWIDKTSLGTGDPHIEKTNETTDAEMHPEPT